MEARFEKITPELAQQYLAANTENYRKMSPTRVKIYADDMRTGRWEENGETICFSESGTLKDGQHRLAAIVESGKTMHMLVVRDVKKDVNVYDCGGNRSIQQWGYATGQPVSTVISATSRILLNGFHGCAPRGNQTDFIQQHYDELKEAARIATIGKNHSLGRKGSVALCVYIYRKLQMAHDEMLEEFFRVFNTGNIDTNKKQNPSPALIASRQFLTKLPSGSASIQVRQYEVIMQALQDFVKNRNRKREYSYDENQLELLKEVQKLHGLVPKV